jgi:methionyl-tRNA formyltransferase
VKIALFAAQKVGCQIAAFLGELHEELLSCMVLDAHDKSGLNPAIIAGSRLATPDRIFYSDSLYDDHVLSALRAMSPDLAILAWWPYIIQPSVIEIPRLGCLNFHPSYLPYNRGKHYNFWSIVESAPFGVTLHWVDSGIDTGDIAFQSRIETSWEDTGATLYQKAQREIVRLFKEKFPEIKRGQIPRKPQALHEGSFHRSCELEAASRINLDLQYSGRDLLNVLRARTFPPHSGAWFVEDGKRYEVRIEIRQVEDGIESENGLISRA